MTIETIKLASAVVTLITAFVVGFVVLVQKIKGVHVLINSRMDELLEATRKARAAFPQSQRRLIQLHDKRGENDGSTAQSTVR